MLTVADLDLAGMKELVRIAWRDVGYAERSAVLRTPVNLARLSDRLRQTTNAMNILLIEVERLRMNKEPKDA